MLSWKQIRIICAILLLAPIVHVTYLFSRSTMEMLDHSPATWQREMDDYARQDEGITLPENPIVVVGGLRVKLWQGLEELLAPRPVLMRGIGFAIIEDILHHYDRLIGFYQPDTVVLLPGYSEFHMRDNKSGAELAEAIAVLVEFDQSYGRTRRFYVFTPIKTPLNPGDYPRIDEAATLLEELARGDPRVVLLDANALLAGPDGKPRPNFFRGDGINLNEHGYLRLSVLLDNQLKADTQPPGAGAEA
jgi:hypothetical protein